MNAGIERRLALQGSYNFRDIGGYATTDGATTKWHRLFRSDALNRLTDDDLALLQPLGVASLIDLRTVIEVEAGGPSRLIELHRARHRHHPFLQDPVDPNDLNSLPELPLLYSNLIDTGHDTIRGVFTALAETETYPAVVHCAAGKDRTGIVVSLLLRTLGVPDETIVADYVLTEFYLDQFADAWRQAGGGELLQGVRHELTRSPAATMQGFLAIIDDRFGGTESLLVQCGLTPDIADQLRHQLLDPANG